MNKHDSKLIIISLIVISFLYIWLDVVPIFTIGALFIVFWIKGTAGKGRRKKTEHDLVPINSDECKYMRRMLLIGEVSQIVLKQDRQKYMMIGMPDIDCDIIVVDTTPLKNEMNGFMKRFKNRFRKRIEKRVFVNDGSIYKLGDVINIEVRSQYEDTGYLTTLPHPHTLCGEDEHLRGG